MIRPSLVLIAGAALAVLPVCTLAGVYPPAAPVCYGVLTLCAAVAAVDAMRASRALAAWKASTPTTLNWYKDREETLSTVLEHGAGETHDVRVHVELPAEIEAKDNPRRIRIEHAGVVEFRCTPRRRGDFALRQCHLEQKSPLRLWLAARTLAVTADIRVYPDLRKERAADLTRGHNPAGAHRRRQLGKGREFDKLREYERGDSFEDIDWKATARRQSPVVKTYRIERTQEIYAVVDSSRLSARAELLDSYVSAALTLAIAAESQQDRFGLASFSAGVDNFLPAAGGKRHFAFCRDAIYALQPRPVTPDIEEVFSFLHTRLRKRALIVFLTALDDPFLAEAFVRNIRVLSRRHRVLIDVPERNEVRPLFSGELPHTPDQIYTRLAGHIQWAGLREVQKTLERQGVQLAVVNPRTLPAQLARQYLDVKQGQLL